MAAMASQMEARESARWHLNLARLTKQAMKRKATWAAEWPSRRFSGEGGSGSKKPGGLKPPEGTKHKPSFARVS